MEAVASRYSCASCAWLSAGVPTTPSVKAAAKVAAPKMDRRDGFEDVMDGMLVSLMLRQLVFVICIADAYA
ncbi:MAG: hypothetical protein Rhims3KO_12910 [Hyphomicrobiales bacterium]